MNKEVDKLESVKLAFEHWRKTKKKLGRLPDYLWKQVRGVSGCYSLIKICTTLIYSNTNGHQNLDIIFGTGGYTKFRCVCPGSYNN